MEIISAVVSLSWLQETKFELSATQTKLSEAEVALTEKGNHANKAVRLEEKIISLRKQLQSEVTEKSRLLVELRDCQQQAQGQFVRSARKSLRTQLHMYLSICSFV